MLGAICCAGSSCCNCCCTGCSKLGVASKSYSKVSYIILAMSSMIISLIIMYVGRPIAAKFNYKSCEFGQEESDECFGQVSVLRMSFALTCFHILMLIILIPRASFCAAIHDGFWPVKYIVMVGIFVGAWFIKPEFFVVWGNICRGFSILYLFVQAYFLMNLSYLWNDHLMAAMENKEGECYAKFLLLTFSILSTLGSFTWLGLCFKWFWGCSENNFILIETTILLLWFYVASLLRFCNVILRENYTIFVCSMVSLYLVYQLWASLASLPDQKCNELANSKGNTACQIIFGAIFSFITVLSIATASQTTA